jgi:hypothetical protein
MKDSTMPQQKLLLWIHDNKAIITLRGGLWFDEDEATRISVS